MFTVKFYGDDSFRLRILEADSVTVLRGKEGDAEVTLHRSAGNDIRLDVTGYESHSIDGPSTYVRAIIENSAGKTTEIITGQPKAPRAA